MALWTCHHRFHRYICLYIRLNEPTFSLLFLGQNKWKSRGLHRVRQNSKCKSFKGGLHFIVTTQKASPSRSQYVLDDEVWHIHVQREEYPQASSSPIRRLSVRPSTGMVLIGSIMCSCTWTLLPLRSFLETIRCRSSVQVQEHTMGPMRTSASSNFNRISWAETFNFNRISWSKSLHFNSVSFDGTSHPTQIPWRFPSMQCRSWQQCPFSWF